MTIFSVAAFSASAFNFEPLTAVLDSSGNGSVRSFRLTNDGRERVAVRVSVVSRSHAEDGTETNGPVKEDSFVVYPARFVLEPGTTRMLKVQWKGGDIGEKESAYRIIAEQVPVEFQKHEGSGITLLFKYVGSLYVKPPNARNADVRVVSARGGEVEGKRGIFLRLRNDGGVHAVLAEVAVTTHTSDGRLQMRHTGEAVSGILGCNMQAGMERLFFIPYADALLDTAYEADLELKVEN